MATTYPAIKGKIGIYDYYIVTMTVQKAASILNLPRETPGWGDLSIQEKWQRDIKIKRVTTGIYPYLTNKNQDRFFGPLIVAADKLKASDFEPISKFADKGIPNVFKDEIDEIGILTFKEDGMFITLDGQHRLCALKLAMGTMARPKGVAEYDMEADLGSDRMSVILLPINLDAENKNKGDIAKARRIFSTLNKNAKKPSSSENLITDDEDSIAVISRDIADEFINGKRKYDLVRCKSNLLSVPKKNNLEGKTNESVTDPYFTTLDTVYKCNKEIVDRYITGPKTPKDQRLAEEQEKLCAKRCLEVWKVLLNGITSFKESLADKTVKGNKKRVEIRCANLLGKPLPQQYLFEAFLRITTAPPQPALSDAAAIKKLNQIPWDIGNKIWDAVLWKGGKDDGTIVTNQRKLAVDLIVYMCGRYPVEDLPKLAAKYKSAFLDEERKNKNLSIFPKV